MLSKRFYSMVGARIPMVKIYLVSRDLWIVKGKRCACSYYVDINSKRPWNTLPGCKFEVQRTLVQAKGTSSTVLVFVLS